MMSCGNIIARTPETISQLPSRMKTQRGKRPQTTHASSCVKLRSLDKLYSNSTRRHSHKNIIVMAAPTTSTTKGTPMSVQGMPKSSHGALLLIVLPWLNTLFQVITVPQSTPATAKTLTVASTSSHDFVCAKRGNIVPAPFPCRADKRIPQ